MSRNSRCRMINKNHSNTQHAVKLEAGVRQVGAERGESSLQGESPGAKAAGNDDEDRKVSGRHHHLRVHHQGQACAC